MTHTELVELERKNPSKFKKGDMITLKDDIEKCYNNCDDKGCPSSGGCCALTYAMLHPRESYKIIELRFDYEHIDGKIRPYWKLDTAGYGYFLEGCVVTQDADNEI
jgi:hypothetical protein